MRGIAKLAAAVVTVIVAAGGTAVAKDWTVVRIGTEGAYPPYNFFDTNKQLQGFDVGADDYVTKPFSPRELLARVRALLRRAAPETGDDPIEIAGLRLEPDTFRVYANGEPLSLSPTEFRLLHCFMKQPDRVMSRSRLLDNVWGDRVYIEERTVDVHIRRLRLALEPAGLARLIETVRGGGYRFLPG